MDAATATVAGAVLRKQMNVNYKGIRVHKEDVNDSRITGATN